MTKSILYLNVVHLPNEIFHSTLSKKNGGIQGFHKKNLFSVELSDILCAFKLIMHQDCPCPYIGSKRIMAALVPWEKLDTSESMECQMLKCIDFQLSENVNLVHITNTSPIFFLSALSAEVSIDFYDCRIWKCLFFTHNLPIWKKFFLYYIINKNFVEIELSTQACICKSVVRGSHGPDNSATNKVSSNSPT